jgi:hypothetical protein
MKRINSILMMVLFTVGGCHNSNNTDDDTDTGTDTDVDTDTDTDSDSDTDTDTDSDSDTDTDVDTDTDSDTDTDVDAGTDCSYLTDGELNIVGNWCHCGYAGDDAHRLEIGVVMQPDGCYLSFSGPAAEVGDGSGNISGEYPEENGEWPLSFCVLSNCYTLTSPPELLIEAFILVSPYTSTCFERYNPADADAGPDSGL